MIFQVPSTINKIITMSDGGLRLYVDTQEISTDEKALVFSLHKKLGWFVYKEAEIVEQDIIDIPDEMQEFKNEKSSSEILRNRLYVYYTKTFGKKEGFETWRRNEMDKIGIHYLNKIKD